MGYVSTLMRLQSAFEHAGIRFLDKDFERWDRRSLSPLNLVRTIKFTALARLINENGGRQRVRLRKRQQQNKRK